MNQVAKVLELQYWKDSASVLPMHARFLKILFWECQTSVLLT